MTSKLPPVFIISLARATERRESIKHQLDPLGVNYEIVDAVDGKTLNLDDYRDRLNPTLSMHKVGHELPPNMIGCYLSHYNLWERMVAENIPQAIILEDDAVLNADFAPVVADVLSFDVPWDVIHLAAPRKKRTDKMADNLGGRGYVFGRYQKGLSLAHAYIVSLTGAKKLLTICREISVSLDLAWYDWWRNGLLYYCIAPKLAQQIGESMMGYGGYKIHWGIIDRMRVSLRRRRERIYCWLYRKTHPLPKITRTNK